MLQGYMYMQVAGDRARRAANPHLSTAVLSPYRATSSAAEYADTGCAVAGALLARQFDGLTRAAAAGT